MAFPLSKVLRALLFASSGPLSVKDVQAVFTRFHTQGQELALGAEEKEAIRNEVDGNPEATATDRSPEADSVGLPSDSAEEPGELPVETAPLDDELYREVPSLITAAQIREAMDALSTDLRASGEGYVLVEGHNGWRLVAEPRYARWIRLLRNEPPPMRLSQSALETLAIVAYRQPVTRADIEAIRGVAAEGGISRLLERDLIYVVGRADLPGRPIQYGTTDQFLAFVGIRSLEELPASDVLSPRQIDGWLADLAKAKPPTEAEVGLAAPELPLDAPAVVEPSPRAPAADEAATTA